MTADDLTDLQRRALHAPSAHSPATVADALALVAAIRDFDADTPRDPVPLTGLFDTPGITRVHAEAEHFHGCPTPTGRPFDCDWCQDRSRGMAE